MMFLKIGQRSLLNYFLFIIFVLSSSSILASELQTINGTDFTSKKACLNLLIQNELKKNRFYLNNILLEETPSNQIILDEEKEYRFKADGYGVIRYTGFIFASVKTNEQVTICSIGKEITFSGSLCKTTGCPVITFELNSEILRYSGSKKYTLPKN